MNPIRQFVIAAVVIGVFAGIGSAHSFPEKESPAAGETVAAAPAEVAIRFDAPIEHLFAQLRVINADGKDQVLGAPNIDADGRILSVKLAHLTPGDYTVNWAVVCIDTHHTSGSYKFAVAGGSS